MNKKMGQKGEMNHNITFSFHLTNPASICDTYVLLQIILIYVRIHLKMNRKIETNCYATIDRSAVDQTKNVFDCKKNDL